MCKSCIVLVVFIAFTEVIHSFQLYNWNATRSWIITSKWPDLQKVTTACLSGGREGCSQCPVHDSMFTRQPWLVLPMTLKYICLSCSQVYRRGVCLYFTLFRTPLILKNGGGFVVVFLWHCMSCSPSNTKTLQQCNSPLSELPRLTSVGFLIGFGRKIVQMEGSSRPGLIPFNISIEPHLTKACESVEFENWRW